jgi:hypothetical protein
VYGRVTIGRGVMCNMITAASHVWACHDWAGRDVQHDYSESARGIVTQSFLGNQEVIYPVLPSRRHSGGSVESTPCTSWRPMPPARRCSPW